MFITLLRRFVAQSRLLPVITLGRDGHFLASKVHGSFNEYAALPKAARMDTAGTTGRDSLGQ